MEILRDLIELVALDGIFLLGENTDQSFFLHKGAPGAVRRFPSLVCLLILWSSMASIVLETTVKVKEKQTDYRLDRTMKGW